MDDLKELQSDKQFKRLVAISDSIIRKDSAKLKLANN